MNKNLGEIADDPILYELLEYLIRKQEPELAKYKNDAAILPATGTIKNALRYLNHRYFLPESISQQISLTLPWKFAVGDNGRLLTILQENLVEIRKSKDEYSSVVGKASVPKDSFPQWRKIAWSPDCSILVLASSNGHISVYNSLGNNIFNISPKVVSQNPHILEVGDAVASMVFIKPRLDGQKWAYELIFVTYCGLLRSYYVSGSNGYKENHEFSFGNFYRNGVTSVTYNERYNLLFVAGNGITQTLTSAASETGLTTWRLLNDYPYYKLSFTTEGNAIVKSKFSIWNFIPRMHPQVESIIFKASISPSGNFSACLHTDGSITLWSLPNLLLQKRWKLSEQPDYNARNPLGISKYKKFPLGLSEFHPVDIGWWSNHSVIIARYSGSVSVCSIKDLRNLLGASPEFLAGQPQISELSPGRGFLSLDCETFLTSKKRNRDSSNEAHISEASSESEKEDEQEPITILNYTTSLVQSALYSITDMERFQPRKKKSKVVHRIYRILGLKSTTPEELYSRKIDIEEYGEALALANMYNLDTDLVYQTQWRKSEFSLIAIQDHLSKVSKRSWVLNECVMRVPETLEAARELLNFGLRGANLETLLAIGVNDDGKFTPEEADDNWTNQDKSNLNLMQVQKENKILGKIDIENLVEGQKDLVRYRRKLLDHLDKLQTYEIMLESSVTYNKDFYEEFRELTAVENAVRFAKDSNYQGVEIMFTYHGEKLMPHWLAIISYFPETLNPSNYQKLLPECDSEGQLFLLYQRELRQKDWSEKAQFNKVLGMENDDGSQFIYDADPSLCAYRNTQLTLELLQRWYKSRAYQIERDSYMVDNALELIKIGKSRNITGLENLLFELETLDDLVYKVYLENMSLSQLEKLTDLEKITLLMSRSDEKNFVTNIKYTVLPFIKRKQKYVGGECQEYLLRDYLVSLSKDDLTLPAKFFEYLKQSQNSEIISVVEDIATLALECIYACHDFDMYQKARDIFESIPKHSSSEHLSADPVEELERELDCIKILRKYNVKTTLNYIKENKSKPDAVKLLLIQMAKSLNTITPPPGETVWAELLNDMLEIHGTTFLCLDIEICFEICVSARLESGIKRNIQNCANLIETRKNEQSLLKVSYERAVDLILQASTEYFNSSKSLTDPNMELAKASLHLIADDNAQIKEEYELINSLQILSEFNVNVLPLQVRLSQDRLKLIENCLNCREDAYKSKQRLLTLSNYLRIEKNNTRNREGKVLELIAQKAFEVKDYDGCASACQQLIDNNYLPAWKTVLNLGYCDNFEDLKFRKKCLWFTMNNGPVDLLEESLKQIHLLEIQILHKNLQSWMPIDEAEDFENEIESDDEFTDAMTTPQVEVKEFVPDIFGASTEIVKSSAELVKKSTFGIIRNMSNKNFWMSLHSNLIGETESATPVENEIQESEKNNVQSFPCFYESLHEICKISNLDTKYTRYSMQEVQNTKLKLCHALLRVALLSESACYGLEASDIDHLLLECARYTITEDCLLGLAYLLSLRDNSISHVQTVFNELPCTELYIQLIAYFYSIEFYKKLNPDSKKVYSYDPIELIATMMAMARKSNECKLQKALLHWQSYLLDDESLNAKNAECSVFESSGNYKTEDNSSTIDSTQSMAIDTRDKFAASSDRNINTAKSEFDSKEPVHFEVNEHSKERATFSELEEETAWDDNWGDFSDHSNEEDENHENIISESPVPCTADEYAIDIDVNATEEDRFRLLEKLVSTVQTKEQYLRAKEILLRWPKFTNAAFTTVDKHPALKIIEMVTLYVTKKNTRNYELKVLQEYKELINGQTLPKDTLVEFFKRRDGQCTPEHNIYLRLCCNESSLHEEAVNIIKEKYQTLKLSPPMLDELFFKNLTASFGPNHAVYNQIIEKVFLDYKQTEIERNIKILIDKLIQQRNIPHAVTLLNQLEGVPSSLRTFESCFHLLTRK